MVNKPRRFEMADQDKRIQDGGLSDEELQGQEVNERPEREAMSLIDANLAAPVNAAVALNVLSDGSVAYANATQDVDIDQSN